MFKIAIVDNSVIYREGVKVTLGRHDAFQIVAEGTSVSDIPEIHRISRPDVIVMDFVPGDTLNLIATRKMIENMPETKFVILTEYKDDAQFKYWLEAGIHGYILKDLAPKSIIQAIHDILEGGKFIDPTITHCLLKHYRRLANNKGNEYFDQNRIFKPLHLLTNRECETIQLLAEGKGTRDISKEFSISETTVKNHIHNILKKMKEQDRTNAVVTAIKNGWVDISVRTPKHKVV